MSSLSFENIKHDSYSYMPPLPDVHNNNNSFPRLEIIEQCSLAQERVAKNGEQKYVHVVVKNTPFNISVGFENICDSNFDFNIVTVEALLMYDCEAERFVDFVNNKPLEYKGTISKNGDRMILEIRLKKLSSHLEDMFFKIRIKGVDTKTKQDIPGLYTTSQPIKVVSKPEQVTRILQKQRGEKPAPKKTKTTRKRSYNDMMYETMQNIEKQQEEQKTLLKQLLEKQGQSSSTTGSSIGVLDILPSSSSSSNSSKKKGAATDLEQAIQNLLEAYDNTDPVERPLKIRRVLGNYSATHISTLLEISGQFQCNVQREFPAQASNFNSSIQSSTSNAQDDLQLIDDFYRELLLPSSHSF